MAWCEKLHSFSEISGNVFLLGLRGYSCNAYLLHNAETKTSLALDPGLEGKEIWRKALDSVGAGFANVGLVLLTHSHYDHACNARLFPNATVAASKNALEKLEANDPTTFFPLAKLSYEDSGKHKILKDGDALPVGGLEIKCISTPGHSNCSMCFFERKSRVFFSGDTIFPDGAIPRIFDSSKRELARSYEKIEKLALGWQKEGCGPKILAPGHGNAGDFWEEFEKAKNALRL